MTPDIIAGDPRNFRNFILWLTGGLTLSWVLLLFVCLLDVYPGQVGYGAAGAVLVTIVFVIFILPAFLLAFFNRLVGLAFALAVLGLVCYAFDPILQIAAYFDR